MDFVRLPEIYCRSETEEKLSVHLGTVNSDPESEYLQAVQKSDKIKQIIIFWRNTLLLIMSTS
jgi:hypothetical protein